MSRSHTVGQDSQKVFGRYLLLDRLSRGGMGEIYLARVGEIEGFQKPCIIKKILPQLAADHEFIQRFVAEAQIAVKLQHANIAPVYEVGLVDGDYFLALEFVDGRDLRRTLNRAREEGHRLPPELGLYIVREVAAGLAYAHRRTDEAGQPMGLVHCDVSPPNVLLGFEGEVKLIDFGIARSAAHFSEANVGFGKVGYMAPEQLGGFGGVVDRRTDVYATGVMLFELLTGQRPFDFEPSTSSAEMMSRMLEGAPRVSDRAPGLGRRFDGLVGRALEADPARRTASAEELRDATQRLLVEIAPTFSGEDLGRALRRLFADEIDAGDSTAVARAADLRPFEKALDEARSHTVSFALSDAWTSPPTAQRLALRGAPQGPATDGRSRPAWLRRPVILGLSGAAALLAAFALLLGRSGGRPPPAVRLLPPEPTPAAVATPGATPPPARAPAIVPEAAAPVLSAPGAAVRPPQPAAPPLPSVRAAAPSVREHGVRAHTPSGPGAAEVQRRLEQVQQRYTKFEKKHGKVLEARYVEFLNYNQYHHTELGGLLRRAQDLEKAMTALER